MTWDFWIFYDYNWSQKSVIESFLYSRDITFGPIQQIIAGENKEAIICQGTNILYEGDLPNKIIDACGIESYIKCKDYKFTLTNKNIEIPLELTDTFVEAPEFHFIISNTPIQLVKGSRYSIISEKNEIYSGQLLEIWSGTKWIDSVVENIDRDWENLYSLLSKYKRVRKKI